MELQYGNCCRLRNQLNVKGLKDREYTNSFGVGGTNIGSHRVVAINLPQIAYIAKYSEKDTWSHFWNILRTRISLSQDILDIHKDRLMRQIQMGLIPLYNYGCINIEKQYSTLGFIGLYECLEIMGLDITTEEGIKRGKEILEVFNKMNDKRTESDGRIRNVEQIPGEAAAVTFAAKDALQFAMAEYKMYSNQYIPLVKNVPITVRIFVHGQFDSDVGGGSILHLDVDQELTVEQIIELIEFAAKNNVIYFAIDNPFSQCTTCGKTFIGKYDKSPCHQADTRKFMRVVGFRTDVSGWNKERRVEFKNRYCYHDFELN